MRFNSSLFLAVACLSLVSQFTRAEGQRMYIASPAKPTVIYLCSLDIETGKFSGMKPVAEVSTGFLALHPSLPILYAASRERVEKGNPNGAVRAYRILGDGGLKLVGKQETNDNGTTHIDVAKNGKSLLVCHYGGAGTTLIPLDEHGELQPNISQIVHKGSSADPRRQTRPHPHGIAISIDSQFACVADLGNDHVEVFRIGGGELKPHAFWKASPGAGPRHVSFHQNGKWLYCINELDSTIDVLEFETAKGQLRSIQTISTLPESYSDTSSTAEVVVHPSGKFLYGSNRGHNSTAVFSIDASSGKLKLVEREATGGDHPRFVGLEPSGRLYVAANMKSDNILSFRIDQKTGALTPTGNVLEVARPMCVVFSR